MYAGLWHILPGPWWLRVLLIVVLAIAVIYGLFFYVFPWVSSTLLPQDVTVA